MNLRIGIDNCKPGWEIILKQIGISYSQILTISDLSPEDFSVIIITEMHTTLENKEISKFMEAGGAVLFTAGTNPQLISYKQKKVRFLCSMEDTPFSEIGLVDLYSRIYIPVPKEIKSIDSGLKIFSMEPGINLILPYDINELILNTAARRKKFYAEKKELPSEIVSQVSKGKLRKIVALSLEYLHNKRNLPFVHKWYYPEGWKGLFIFRLDTDFCSMEDANSMYNICRKNNIKATWFLDTISEDRLQNYSKMEDQEMALHCERHLVFDDYERNSNNLKTALSKLETASIDPKGFAAPFGDWNPALAKALEDLEFKYSSEFTLDYDDLPFFPPLKDGFSAVLQIPIHPISSGRLRRSHFSEEEMLRYFRKLIEEKQRLNEPIIIYHHPHHHHFEVFEEVLKIINKKKFHNITMSEYSSWWRKRNRMKLNLKYDGNEIISENPKENIYLRISTKDGYAVTNMSTRILLSKLDLKQPEKIIQPEKIERTRKNHWRDLLYNYESKKRKKSN